MPGGVDTFPTHSAGQTILSADINNLGAALRATEQLVFGPLVLNVKGYGARGDGSTDDTAAIQAALNVAPTLAGTGIDIVLPPGQYNLTAPLLIRGTTRLRGAGTNQVFLYGPGVTGALIKSATTATILNHVVFAGFTINGGNSTTLTAGIDWTGMNTSTIDGVDVRNINTANAAGFTANGGTADSSGATLRDCGAYSIANGYGFYFQSLNGLNARGLKAMTNKMSFFLNAITEANLTDLLTSDNTNTGDAASMKVQNCNRTTIKGLVADDNQWINVFVNGSTNCTFSGWAINDNNHAFSVANGGLLYVSGAKHCSFNGIELEFVYATPIAGTVGLTLDNTSGGQNQYDTWSGLHVNGTGNANLNAIHWVGGASGLGNQYKAVTLSGCGTYETPLETDVYGSVECRTGIVTRNSGASTGTGAQQAIAHGLKFTPTRQQIALWAGSATAAPWHSAAPDATNLYVTAANGQPWYWATAG